MNAATAQTGDVFTIKLEGSFTFDDHVGFRTATRAALEAEGVARLVLDLGAVGYMDSSALGMLLLLREKAVAKGIPVILRNPTPTVRNILQVVQFGDMFEIQD